MLQWPLLAVALAALRAGTVAAIPTAARHPHGATGDDSSPALQLRGARDPHYREDQHVSEDHGHQSIFHIHAHELDRVLFWMIITGMLLFTILVDRCQWLATYYAGSSRCNQMFLSRVISELMMFGVVAISVFLFSQLSSVDSRTHLLFEFVDLLCSFAACFLILMGVILFVMRNLLEVRLNTWSQDDEGKARDLLKSAQTLEDIPKNYYQRLKFEAMRAQFFAMHKLSLKSFSYNFHLVESLNQDICDLININWITWVITTAASVVVVIARWQLGDSMDTHPSMHPHILSFCILTWFVWLACVVLLGVVQWRLQQLHGKLGLNSLEDLRKSFESAVAIEEALSQGKPLPKDSVTMSDEDVKAFARSSDITEQSTQVLGLGLSFMLGFYVMHVAYNINLQHLGWQWHLLFMLPLFTGLLLILPLALQAHASIMAFCGPEQDVMDAVVSQVAEAHSDLEFVRSQFETGAAAAGVTGGSRVEKWATEQLKEADSSTFSKGDGLITRGEFNGILKKLHANVSRERSARLYTRLTHGSSEMTYNALVTAVFHPEQADMPLAPK